MLDKDKQRQIAERITQSTEFQKTPNYQDLLIYLTKESIKGEYPKETCIAIDVLGRGKDFNPATDTIVRYYMHQLRRKLDAYYSKEGKDDSWRLVIPKGHYRVEFMSRKSSQKTRSIPLHILVPSMLCLFASGAALYFWLQLYQIKKESTVVEQKNVVWNDFFSSPLSTLIVLGDYFLFREYRPELERHQEIRDWHVEGVSDLYAYQQRLPEKDIFIPEFTMLPHHTPENLMALIPGFTLHRVPIKVVRSSDLKWEDIKNQNLVYSGKLKNLGKLQPLVQNLTIQYSWIENEIYLVDEQNDTTRVFERFRSADARDLRTADYYNRDYAVVAKVPTGQNSSALVVAGFGHISMIEAIDLLTNKNRLDSMLDSLMIEKPDEFYFEILLEVTGYKRTGLESRVQYYQPISLEPFLNKLSQTVIP